MSFTKDVKDEISRIECTETLEISLLSAIVLSGAISYSPIIIQTEINGVARRIYTLFKKLFSIYPKITVRQGYNYNKKMIYILEITNNTKKILKKLGISKNTPEKFIIADEELIRAFLCGIFMMCGSISDPKKSRYHLEFNFNKKTLATLTSNLLNKYELNSKILHRDNRYMVYIKEAEKIGNFLRMIDAYKAVMYFENIRIYRDHKNMTNRLNNCEQANVDRIIETANKQVKDIETIINSGGILEEKEKIVAKYRLKYKDSSLTELSTIISLETNQKITKSGLYHRFKKINNLANKIRNSQN